VRGDEALAVEICMVEDRWVMAWRLRNDMHMRVRARWSGLSACAPCDFESTEGQGDVRVAGPAPMSLLDLQHKSNRQGWEASRAARLASFAFEAWCEWRESSGGSGFEEAEAYEVGGHHRKMPQPASQSARRSPEVAISRRWTEAR
jgi:hypothetical protein